MGLDTESGRGSPWQTWSSILHPLVKSVGVSAGLVSVQSLDLISRFEGWGSVVCAGSPLFVGGGAQGEVEGAAVFDEAFG